MTRLSEEELRAERALHRPVDTMDPTVQRCYGCEFDTEVDDTVWPCPRSRLLAHLDAITEEAQKMLDSEWFPDVPDRYDPDFYLGHDRGVRAVLALLRGSE